MGRRTLWDSDAVDSATVLYAVGWPLSFIADSVGLSIATIHRLLSQGLVPKGVSTEQHAKILFAQRRRSEALAQLAKQKSPEDLQAGYEEARAALEQELQKYLQAA